MQSTASRLSRPLALRAAGFMVVLVGALLFCLGSAHAQGALREGTDFQRIKTPQATDSPGKIEVIEFFGYWCPHCNAFEPQLNEWIRRQPADVVVKHVPWAFRDEQVPLQRLYYVLEALGRESELRAKVFGEIHVSHNYLNTMELQADFAARNGIDRKKFIDLYNSFSIQSKTRRATQMADAYGIDGVPEMAVNGKFTISAAPNSLAVVDSLIAGERRK